MTAVHKTKWFMPLFSLAIGLVFLAALWAGGDRGGGIAALVVMSALGLLILAGGRNSGNSSEPHLHFHVQDRRDLFGGARGLPVSFVDYLADGRRVARGTPVQGQFIQRG